MELVEIAVAVIGLGGVSQSLVALLKSWLRARRRTEKIRYLFDAEEVELAARDSQQARVVLEDIMGRLRAEDPEGPS